MAREIIQTNEDPRRADSPKQLEIIHVLSRDRNLLRLLIITVCIFVLMGLLRPELFFTLRNFRSMSFQFPEFGILAIGMMLTMLSGGIDLSVVGAANLSGILAALTMTNYITPETSSGGVLGIIGLSILVSLTIGILCGIFNGLLVAKVNIPPILATLGTMQLFTGTAIVITRGHAVLGFPDQFLFIGNGLLWIFPVPLIIFTGVAVVFAFILNRASFGFKLYMLGTNPTASRFSGINNTRVLLKTYMLSGLLAGLAGITMVARTNAAKADFGTSYILQAVLVAILGGVNPNGGFGTISGLVLAILSLQFLSSGFNMLRFSTFFTEFVWGLVLILVMVINYLSNTYRSRSGKKKRSTATG
ncbi:MAG TPA: ABC transporter permease [Atribacteraceae bacterium]|nr:ABC transporter permease [Atribacteraceae bacterium]